MHMHLVETAYQKEYARRRGGGTAVDYLQEHGLLGPRMTLGHGTWLTEGDIELAAETGTHVCHNASSNLRLRSGIAPVNRLEARGVNVGLGMDEAGINDDRDMLQEMRVALNVHREPGFDDSVPTTAQVLRMATANGAQTTPFGTDIGTLEVGKAADLVVMSWRDIAFPVPRSRHRRLGNRRDRAARQVVGREDGAGRRGADPARRTFHAGGQERRHWPSSPRRSHGRPVTTSCGASRSAETCCRMSESSTTAISTPRRVSPSTPAIRVTERHGRSNRPWCSKRQPADSNMVLSGPRD